MPKINGDLIPSTSGIANLGVNGSIGDVFDITSIAPFSHIHMNSGIWHDITGQSGVIRYSRAAAAFQVSVDGGKTFNDVATGGTVVTSIGVLGDVNLTGNVDLATPASGFMTIDDSSDASPLLFAVDQLGLSGLWRFPTQGFNGRVVNALTDSNGTEAQGVINVVGASGIVADIIGQTLTITPGNTVPRSFATAVGSSNPWVVTHNLGSSNVIVQVFDATAAKLVIDADDIEVTNSNTVTIRWNSLQAGTVVIFAAY